MRVEFLHFFLSVCRFTHVNKVADAVRDISLYNSLYIYKVCAYLYCN